MRRLYREAIIVGALVVACGGEGRQANSADDSVDEYGMEAEDDMGSEDSESKSASSDSEEAPEAEEGAASEAAEPQFPDNATVTQAINAVPPGSERLNIEPEALGKPLQDPALYEPCKVGSQHFKLKVAVWDGRAVGVDVDTKNPKLAECIKQQIRGVEWQDKVKSLNTVEFAL